MTIPEAQTPYKGQNESLTNKQIKAMKKEFNVVINVVKELINGAKCVLVAARNIPAFVKCCEAFEVRINGGAFAFDDKGGIYGQFFYVD